MDHKGCPFPTFRPHAGALLDSLRPLDLSSFLLPNLRSVIRAHLSSNHSSNLISKQLINSEPQPPSFLSSLVTTWELLVDFVGISTGPCWN